MIYLNQIDLYFVKLSGCNTIKKSQKNHFFVYTFYRHGVKVIIKVKALLLKYVYLRQITLTVEINILMLQEDYRFIVWIGL